MFDVCTTGDTAHIDMIFKFLSHTRQHGRIDILHCCNDPWLYVSEVTWQWWDEYFARNARCTVTTDLLVWYSNIQKDFSLGAAISSLHTLASPSDRNVNYDEKQFTGKKLSCSFHLYKFGKNVSYGFPVINCCNLEVRYETPWIALTCCYNRTRCLTVIIINVLFLWESY